MAQTLTESGFYKGGPKTYYTRSGNTNAFGMGYSKRGYATSYFTTGSGEKWAIYPNFGQAILDRFAWDKTRPKNRPQPNESKNIDDYITKLRDNSYWVESGRDRGYTAILYGLLAKYGDTFDQLFIGNIAVLASAIMYLK
jgi:hypothetical protein